MFCCLHCSDLESASDSVDSTSQSNHLTLQDSSVHTSDNVQAASHDGDNPGTTKTNDITSDTPHSQLEQNSAPSANGDSSQFPLLRLIHGRELDKSDKNNLQEDALSSLEEDVPGEKSKVMMQS